MATRLLHPRETEFYSRFPENFILVENYDDGRVVVRAALDNYSECRKCFFIHELASEGFIPDQYQFMSNVEQDGFLGVRWVVDSSWLVVPPKVLATSHRTLMILLIGIFMLVAVATLLVAFV
ncbi:MAG TPA: hypothetical protein VK961_23145 [Chthoniobacter sp.]|nr:hypothetical protein [Chthoniobacter sp.]